MKELKQAPARGALSEPNPVIGGHRSSQWKKTMQNIHTLKLKVVPSATKADINSNGKQQTAFQQTRHPVPPSLPVV